MKDSMNTVLTKNIKEALAVYEALSSHADAVTTAAKAIAGALKSGHKLLACGNGGSAADAAHLTTEFVCRFMRDRRPYPAICLSTHGGDLTAVGNDYAFADVFARQVEAFGKTGDVLCTFTTSGQSPNILAALRKAKELGVTTISFLGKDGGKAKGLGDVELIVASQTTARIQEAHKLLLHTICEMIEIELGHLPERA
jgi:phosphoheptose isomerase